jgi:hypothetical protein
LHLYKLGKRSLSLLAILVALSVPAPVRPVGAAQAGPRVAVEPSEVTVELGQTFTVKVVVEDVSDLAGYEIHLGFDPAVVELVEVEQGGFLESTGRSIIGLGPQIDAEAGTVVVGAVSLGEGPGPEGGGELVIFTWRAVDAGESDLDLLDERVTLQDTAGGTILLSTADGRVRVGSGAAPTEAPSPQPAATETPTGTPGATSAATATPSEEPTTSSATATKTVTGTGTSAPTATISGSADAVTSVPSAAPDQTPSETRPSEATKVPQTDEAEEGASSTSTGTPAAGATDAPATIASATRAAEAPAERPGLAGRRGWLIGAAAVLAVLGAALIGGGVLLFGGRRQVDGDAFVEDEGEMDDVSSQTDDPDRASGGTS